MHAHDCEVSPCAVIKAKELVDGYKEAGYDGIVITNHFDKGIMHLWGETTEEHYQTYLRGYELAKEEGERVGLRVILGMEIRLECGPEDYLVYGCLLYTSRRDPKSQKDCQGRDPGCEYHGGNEAVCGVCKSSRESRD